MRCDLHCPPDGGSLGGVVAVAVLVAGMVAVLAAVLAVTRAVEAVLPVVTLAILGMCAAGTVAVWRLARYGRVPQRQAVTAAPAQVALPRGTQLAIEAPKVTVVHDEVSLATRELRRL